MHVGGGKRISEDLGIPFLGSIPIDPKICENSDSGMPFIVNHSNSPSAKAFMEIVKKIEEYLENRRGD